VLTFFEYLRRRAFEAIVSGVHEALGTLEDEPLPDELRQRSKTVAIPPPRKHEQNQPSGATDDACASNEGSETLPAPRKRRGRPPKGTS